MFADRFNGSKYASLHSLYSISLEHIFPHGNDHHDDDKIIRDVVGTIVVVSTRDPLPVEALVTLLENDVKDRLYHPPYYRLDSLRSVLHKDARHGNAIRVCHPSFIDFLTDCARCSARFFVDIPHPTLLWRICLRTMIIVLKFNICTQESSHRFNNDVADLDARMKRAISVDLGYGCMHWPSDVGDASSKEQPCKRISDPLKCFFSGAQSLYWPEARTRSWLYRSNSITGNLLVVKICFCY